MSIKGTEPDHFTDEIQMETGDLIEKGKKSLWKPTALLVGVAALLMIGRLTGVAQYMLSFKGWILELGPLGYVLFSLLFVALTVTAVPMSVLTLLSGVFFGTVHGIILANICATITAGISFFIARYFAYSDTARVIEQRPRLKRLFAMTQRHEAMTVILIRFIPLFPFNLINYGFGLSPISFRTYIFWTWLCMIPGTVIFVAGGDAIIDAVLFNELPVTSIALIGAAAAVAGATFFWVYRLANSYFRMK